MKQRWDWRRTEKECLFLSLPSEDSKNQSFFFPEEEEEREKERQLRVFIWFCLDFLLVHEVCFLLFHFLFFCTF